MNDGLKKRAIFHNILGSFSNFAFLFLTSIVFLPYYFRFISTSGWGIWLGGISFLSLVSALEANISFILTQQLGDKWTKKQPLEFSRYLSAAFLFGVGASVVIILSTWFLRESMVRWVTSDADTGNLFANSFFLYAISLSLTITFGYLNCVTQVFLRTLWSPVFNLFASAIGIVYTILAVPTQGILAIAAGNLIKSSVYATLVTIYVLGILKEKEVRFSFGTEYLWKLMHSIGLPFVSKVGMTLAVSIQNFLVATTISSGATTIFDITKKLPVMVQMLVNMVTVATFTSFSLFYSEQSKEGANHEYTKKYFTIIRILLLIPLAAIFLAGKEFVALWVGPDKFGGNLLLGLLCLTALTDQLRLILSQQYYAVGKFNLTSLTDTLFAISFILVAFLLIPVLKLNGIVIAGIIANMVYFCSSFFLEKRHSLSMVPDIINRRFFADIGFAGLLTAAAMYLGQLSGNLLIATVLSSTAILGVTLFFYLREKDLILFIFMKFRHSTANR